MAAAQGQGTTGSVALARMLDEAYAYQLEHSLALRIAHGLPITRLPDATFRAWDDEAQFWTRMRSRVASISEAGLSPEERLSLRTLRWESGMRAAKAPFYWVDFSFITPYASPLREVQQAFQTFAIKGLADTGAYLAVLRQVAPLVDSIRAGLVARAARGIYLAHDELPASVGLLRGFDSDAASSPFTVADARLTALDAPTREQFTRTVRAEISEQTAPAFARLTAYLEGDYATHAPHRVGLGQYPGGQAYYQWLVRWHTTLAVTPQQVHRIGLAEVARINADMAAIRREVGFTGTKAEFHASLRKDPRFFATVPEEVGARLMMYARRIEPKLSEYFGHMPRARGDVRRLAPQLEPVMTFGYYDVPSATDSMGHYYYNGSALNERSLLFAGSLISHELSPGHHLQFNLAMENTALPAYRREGQFTAFTEGWGDYASIVAGEMGMYQDAWDRYGRLSMAMFIACRLVVDTGMNAFGWSRERAMQYMLDNALESETQIRSETLRYSTDIPGQALAYAMGSREFQRLRRTAEQSLGPKFDIRAFHDVVLQSGTLPMNVLAEKVSRWVAAQR